MASTLPQAFKENFLGDSPDWYKSAIVAFLVINPILLFSVGPCSGWMGFNCGVYFYSCDGLEVLPPATRRTFGY